jgi:hypothetical protein
MAALRARFGTASLLGNWYKLLVRLILLVLGRSKADSVYSQGIVVDGFASVPVHFPGWDDDLRLETESYYDQSANQKIAVLRLKKRLQPQEILVLHSRISVSLTVPIHWVLKLGELAAVSNNLLVLPIDIAEIVVALVEVIADAEYHCFMLAPGWIGCAEKRKGGDWLNTFRSDR